MLKEKFGAVLVPCYKHQLLKSIRLKSIAVVSVAHTHIKVRSMLSFEACQETKALEIYWAELNHTDIIRDNVGGMI